MQGETSGSAGKRASGAVLQCIATVLRRVSGMPDYQSYLAHVQRCHPEATPLSESQFYSDFIQGRYGDGPTRCC